jgi:hypothetical protein
MQVLTEVLAAKGGQLRQFIVDDKGTVAIGTFGLKGSVNYDNAAVAVDAADLIVKHLGEYCVCVCVCVCMSVCVCVCVCVCVYVCMYV